MGCCVHRLLTFVAYNRIYPGKYQKLHSMWQKTDVEGCSPWEIPPRYLDPGSLHYPRYLTSMFDDITRLHKELKVNPLKPHEPPEITVLRHQTLTPGNWVPGNWQARTPSFPHFVPFISVYADVSPGNWAWIYCPGSLGIGLSGCFF